MNEDSSRHTLRLVPRLALVASIALVTAASPALAAQAVVGKTAPQFSIESLAGRPMNLHDFSGRALFINVFATWCVPCKSELPRIAHVHAQFAGSVTFLGIDEQESPDRVKAFARRMGVTWQIGIDPGRLAAEYGGAALPLSVFIDAEGIVRAIWRGEIPLPVLERNLRVIAPKM